MKNRSYLRNVLGCAVLIIFTVTVMWTGNAVAQTSFGDPFEGNGLKI